MKNKWIIPYTLKELSELIENHRHILRLHYTNAYFEGDWDDETGMAIFLYTKHSRKEAEKRLWRIKKIFSADIAVYVERCGTDKPFISVIWGPERCSN